MSVLLTASKRIFELTPGSSVNPLVDGGRWKNGLADGVDWQNVRIVSGLLCGTNHNPNPSGGPYDDSTGLLTAPWNTDQMAMGTVFTQNQQTASGFNQEVELRLRSTITANVNNGYEFLWRCTTSAQYASIVRWNGSASDFTSLADAVSPPGLQTGYQVMATAVGTVLKMFQRASGTVAWTEIASYDTSGDGTVFSSGSPGVGFWNRQTGSAANTDFGFTYIKLADL